MQPIDVILTNHKRSENLPRIVESIRRQTIPTRITLIDNPADGFRNVNQWCVDNVDRYIQVTRHPYFASIRVIFAQMSLSDWVLMPDDDLLLFDHCLEHWLSKRQENIGMIGYVGRNFVKNERGICEVHRVSEESKERDRNCDLIVRCYLCRTKIFAKLNEAIKLLYERVGDYSFFREDDMLMCLCNRLSRLDNLVANWLCDPPVYDFPCDGLGNSDDKQYHGQHRSKIWKHLLAVS